MEDRVRVKEVKVLSDDWYVFKKTIFDFRLRTDPGKLLAPRPMIEATGRRFSSLIGTERQFS